MENITFTVEHTIPAATAMTTYIFSVKLPKPLSQGRCTLRNVGLSVGVLQTSLGGIALKRDSPIAVMIRSSKGGTPISILNTDVSFNGVFPLAILTPHILSVNTDHVFTDSGTSHSITGGGDVFADINFGASNADAVSDGYVYFTISIDYVREEFKRFR